MWKFYRQYYMIKMYYLREYKGFKACKRDTWEN